jgi:hypothetical protein
VGAGAAASKMGAFAVKLGLVAAAVGLVANKLVDMVKESQKFITTVNSNTVAMGDFNRQTKGMIDTATSYEKAVELTNAKIQISEKQFAALGTAAASMSASLGEGEAGATARFNKLIKSVIQGSERALIPFGIQLDETEDKVVAQAEAIEKLTAMYGDMEFELTTAEQKADAFGNTLGTVIDFEVAAATRSMADFTVGLLDGSDALFQWEQDLVETNGQMAEHYSLLTDLDVIRAANNQTVQESVERGEDMWIIQGRLIQQNEFFTDSEIEKAQAYLETKDIIEETLESERRLAAFREFQINKARAAARQGSDVEKFRASIDDMGKAGTNAELSAAFGTALKLLEGMPDTVYSEIDLMDMMAREQKRVTQNQRIIESVGGGRGGGGRGRARRERETSDPVIQAAESFGVQRRGEDAIAGFRGATEAGGGIGEAMARAQAEGRKARFQEELALIDAENEEKEEKEKMHQERMLAIRQDSVDASANVLSGVSAIIDKDSEKGFKAAQSFAYAANIMQTARGIMAAVTNGLEYGGPAGWALAIANSTAVGLMGAAQGKKIREQKYNKTGGTSGSAPRPSFNTGSMGSGGGGGGDTFNFSIMVEGQTIQQSVIRSNEIASQNGEKHFQMGES